MWRWRDSASSTRSWDGSSATRRPRDQHEDRHQPGERGVDVGAHVRARRARCARPHPRWTSAHAAAGGVAHLLPVGGGSSRADRADGGRCVHHRGGGRGGPPVGAHPATHPRDAGGDRGATAGGGRRRTALPRRPVAVRRGRSAHAVRRAAPVTRGYALLGVAMPGRCSARGHRWSSSRVRPAADPARPRRAAARGCATDAGRTRRRRARVRRRALPATRVRRSCS